ncbi:MAG: Hsp33 family molecular chaperone HslO [Chitinispirillales bacterium]|jgi:molecular chaperone Hsp33|nr:Hsp33 family molecular chaperone HslO [Chitinispirillales bacterium]
MPDYLLKAISKSGKIRAYAAITTDTVNCACKIQNPAALSEIILGNVLTAAGLVAGTLKGKRDRVSLSFRGNGRIGKAISEATSDGKIRGYTANPQTEFVAGGNVKTQLNQSVGTASLLTVTKDLGLKQPYSGTINCITGDIGADVAYYFTQSEQIPSAVAVSTIPNEKNSAVVSGGYLIQKIPDGDDFTKDDTSELDVIIQNINYGISFNSMLERNFTPEKILKNLFSDVKYEILDSINLSFECTCSKEMSLSAMRLFDDETKKEIIALNEKIEIVCEFCKNIYYISSVDLK